MKCKCGNPNCKNEMQVDTLGRTILCLKEIIFSGVKTHEPIMFYVDEEFAHDLIEDMREFIPPVEPQENVGAWNEPVGEEDEEGDYHSPDATFFYTCPACKANELTYADKFCSNCGRQVKWTFGYLSNTKE